MKRILIPGTATLVVFLALILVACGVPAPTAQPTVAPPESTQTAAIVVETVVVTVIPTDLPTEVPSATLPPPTEAPATLPPPTEAVQAVAPTTAPADTSGGLVTIDDALGAGWFVSMTRNRNDFSLRCQLNKGITFSAKPTDPNITQVDFFYRIEDRATGAIFEWVNAGRMIADASGNFVKVLSGEDVHANFRKPNAWFDYQFIGSNPTGVIGRSEKIEKQVTYTFDCP